MLGAELFAPAPVITASGHTASFEDTEQRLAPLLDRVPITRVYDAAALDRLDVPVWAAVTPLARDLTVHAGKGDTPRAARLSAIMEAIERVSAEEVAADRVWRGSFAELSGEALSPRCFDLPFSTRFTTTDRCSWIRGDDLIAERPVWVALDLAISPAREAICQGVETNGLAAGNTVAEATLHALYEVIERDAAAHQRLLRRHGVGLEGAAPALRLLDLTELPEPVEALVARLRTVGLELTAEDLTHDIGVPVTRVSLTDPRFPGRERRVSFEGLGADLDPARALLRALQEAAQAHTSVLVGARDAFEQWTPGRLGVNRMIEWLTAPASVQPLAPSAEPLPSDLAARLRVVLARLREAGFAHCVVVELTRPDLGVPVVRVLLAGASGPYGETTRRPSRRLLRTLLA